MINLPIIITLFIIVFISGYLFKESRSSKWVKPNDYFPFQWKNLLKKNIKYYSLLSENEKLKFEQRIHSFIFNVKITGIRTTINDEDRIYISSSAIIPVFAFPDWEYTFLEEVLLYPGDFTIKNGSQESPKLRGLVGGNGYFDGKMMFSRKALAEGFKNNKDKVNVGIHEFAHIIDKDDSNINGVPLKLLGNYSVKPWIYLMHEKINEILLNKSDIRSYGATRPAEFLAVTTEYFFERPLFMKLKHPRLYFMLTKIYKQNPALRKENIQQISRIKLKELCPCESGLTFKNCCLQFNAV